MYFNHPRKFKVFSGINLIKAVLLIAALLLAGCSNEDVDDVVIVEPVPGESTLDSSLRAIIVAEELTGDPSEGRELPSIFDPKSQLGMKLFFTKSLSGELDVGCVSCHHPMLGGGDDLSLPIGVDSEMFELLGPGRFHDVSGEGFDSGPTVPRNSPTTFNIAMWDHVLFHDGRVESVGKTPKTGGGDDLGIRTPDVAFGEIDANAGDNMVAAQARFPVTSKEEMKNFSTFKGTTNVEVRGHLEQRLGDYGDPSGGMLVVNGWLAEFRDAFTSPDGASEELITFDNIASAISEYERSQVFVDNPWKEYVQGDNDAISDIAKRGAKLFYDKREDGGGNCSACHSGDFFTDEQFHVIGMAQIGRGKGDGINGTEDFGRFRETLDEKDKYAFRTASLLNVAVTGPWGHAGGSISLEQAIRTHLNPQEALSNYDFSELEQSIQTVDTVINTQNVIDKLDENKASGVTSIRDIDLTDTQVAELVVFLQALTDPCVEDRGCLSKWMPDESDADPDALRLNGVGADGDFL